MEQFPKSITLANKQKYDLAGVVYGDGVHATAIVTNDEGSFTLCNDSSVHNTTSCTPQGALMVFFTKSNEYQRPQEFPLPISQYPLDQTVEAFGCKIKHTQTIFEDQQFWKYKATDLKVPVLKPHQVFGA